MKANGFIVANRLADSDEAKPKQTTNQHLQPRTAMKSCNPNLLPAALRGKWLSKKLTPLAVFAALLAASAQAQVTYTPVFTNLWVVSAGTYPGMPANSGNVTSPQLHFEIRKGSTPVNPTKYL